MHVRRSAWRRCRSTPRSKSKRSSRPTEAMADIAWIKKLPIAHRGFHDLNKTRWENTLSAFAAAVERGYAIECDVHLSADGVPVIFHDNDVKRMTGTEG